jgi:transposase-like protein
MAALSKFTAPVLTAFVRAKTGGASHADACRAAGVARCQLYRWLSRGAAGEEPYASFVREVHAAEEAYRQSILVGLRRGMAA